MSFLLQAKSVIPVFEAIEYDDHHSIGVWSGGIESYPFGFHLGRSELDTLKRQDANQNTGFFDASWNWF
ncbi:hypothetical protein GWI33_007077 [Rhynchophorus ferrugineus]|uniref:Uncharacterized protein n=1 Tax=Rhynchophorus ferrugineus TaxID=354439 RepID=A0A834MA84_RHYFE|nr:hypothetical protein GWI33_007077 [Rhynchophorus ferrugineus]